MTTSGSPPQRLERSLALLWGVFVRVALVVFAAYFLWRVRTILATVIVAVILAYAASALVEPLCRRRIRGLSARGQRTLATVAVFIFLALTVFLSVRLLIQPFSEQYTDLARRWPSYQAQVSGQFERLKGWYNNLPPDLRGFLEEQPVRQSLPSPTQWLARLVAATASWTTHIIEAILIPVLAFYFTLDARILRNEFLALVPRSRYRETLLFVREGNAIMRSYIVAQFWLALIAGVFTGAGLALLGMPYALILGIFAGITRAIPVVGPLLGGIPVVLLAFVYSAQTGNAALWVWVLLFFTLMHLVESKVIMPKFLGHHLKLHAVVIIVALLIGGEFFGLLGMFLAAPIAALLRVLLIHRVIRPRARQATPSITPDDHVLRLDPAAAPTTHRH